MDKCIWHKGHLSTTVFEDDFARVKCSGCGKMFRREWMVEYNYRCRFNLLPISAYTDVGKSAVLKDKK